MICSSLGNVFLPVDRFFPAVFFLFILCPVGAEDRVVFDEGRVSLVLPDGWERSFRHDGTTLIGWESSDQRASTFVHKARVDVNLDMADMMERFVDGFATNEVMVLEQAGDLRTGQVKGIDRNWPAIFTTMEVLFRGAQGEFPMKYYLLIFDTGESQYFIQASCVRPVSPIREGQVYAMIRSIVAKR